MPHPANAAVLEQLRARDSVLFFPVSIRPLNEVLRTDLDRDGVVDPAICIAQDDTQVITRDDCTPSQILAIHKGGYKLVPNAELFDQFENVLAESDISLEDVYIVDALSYGGGRVTRTYRFPAHRIDIGDGDYVDLQLRVNNSYDGSRRFSVMLGAFRLVCANGLVIGNTMMKSTGKHTSGLDVSAISTDLEMALARYSTETQIWEQWKATPCPDGIVENVIGAIRGISESAQERIHTYYTNETATQGRTVWALYNAITRWSTHDPIRERAAENHSAIITNRESKVAAVLNHPVFNT